ncbi:MAG: carboxylating nicotinate-nucleotide diphosphorylase [Deltaproteobacteria bacterium]|nr:carboxylating nicotinate-nucleotide diphosphorylase [Deltaproteobacteria bacterium]
MNTKQIHMFLKEDAPQGDITTRAVFGDAAQNVRAEIIAKQAMVVSGFDAVQKILRTRFPKLKLKVLHRDAAPVKNKTVLGLISGPVLDLLVAERLVLNILQRMSGIATQTAGFVKRVHGFKVKILDTRKTTPGLRYEEKRAVKDGGGYNHRVNLSDQYLIKDNHIEAAGSVTLAIQKVKEHRLRSRNKKLIEVEVRNMLEFKEALMMAPDIILLDNMSCAQIKQAVALRNHRVCQGKPQLEISGGVGLHNIGKYARLGVERISIGALTHSVRAADIAINIIIKI